MKKIILFWKKDIINKFIVLVGVMLAVGALLFIFMLFNMPEGKSLTDAVSEFIPIPTTSVPEILTPTPIPTETTLPFNFNITQPPTENIVVVLPTLTPGQLIPTLVPEQFTSTPLTIATPDISLNADCIPKHTSKTGKALSILDGNTIKVMVDGLVYVVRYIGVASPKDKELAEKARLQNASLVFGKEVTLIADQSDKDASGRLLRYVLVGDTFVNLKMIQQGLGSALDTPPDSACAQTFKQADQSAASVSPGDIFGTPTP